jgi:hypothetical protein
LLLLAFLLGMPKSKAHAQVLPATAGAVGGFFAGTLVTTGIVVLEARMGNFIYGMDEFLSVRPELLPVVAGPITGIVLGVTSPETLRRAGTGALIGAAGGAVIGTGLGALIWQTPDGRWAGGIIGAAAGMLAGAAINAARGSGDDSGDNEPPVTLSISLPLGG